jgi:hypothetical protein
MSIVGQSSLKFVIWLSFRFGLLGIGSILGLVIRLVSGVCTGSVEIENLIRLIGTERMETNPIDDIEQFDCNQPIDEVLKKHEEQIGSENEHKGCKGDDHLPLKKYNYLEMVQSEIEK